MTDSTLKSELELHDSTLASVNQEKGQIVITLKPAYIHKTEGVPGVDRGTGWLQDVVFSIESGTVELLPSQLPCVVVDGDLLVEETRTSNVLPLPLDRSGKVELRLVSLNDNQLVVRGARIKAELLGEARYLEDFSGVVSGPDGNA